jgi:2-methylcitrate dehydratase PrpD
MMTDAKLHLSDPPDHKLARFAAELRIGDIPESVLKEARRSLVNVFATALAGCREEAIDIAVSSLATLSGPRTSTLVGRSEGGDAAHAAFINAMSANIFDFDDTHEATIIHPAAPVFSALFAHAESELVTGSDLLRAFVIGGEVECRIGNAVSPYHYAHGWHITSTCGVFGAAAGVGALLGLNSTQMVHAFSIAAVQSCGLVDALGTMAKSVSVGNAARNGLISARLARSAFSGSTQPLTSPRGYLKVYGQESRSAALDQDLGTTWEIAANTYKPYPVGVVLNPVIDACLQLRRQEGLKLDDIATFEITGHPLLRERTDRPNVTTGRESQVSAQHALAIVMERGAAGLDEFTDEAVARTLERGRPTIVFHDDPGRKVASAKLVATTHNGASFSVDIAAALGSRTNPLSDAQLEAKLTGLARRSGFRGDAGRLAEAIWTIEAFDDAAAIVRLTAREG